MNNKNIRYITGLFGFVMTLLWGLDDTGLNLLFFGGGGAKSYFFKLTLADDFIIVVLFFTPYILTKMWQSYKAES